MNRLEEFRELVANPPVIAEKDQYLIKFALSDEELEAVFRLRYRVFNLELQRTQRSS